MSERRRSAPGAESDPFQVWREWVDTAERQLNSALAELMETERFSKGSGRMLDLMMGFQSTMSSATQRYFSTLNLPTRTDILQLGDRLASIEERLGLIEQALGSLAPEGSGRRAAAAAAPRPRRTKKPPGAASDPAEAIEAETADAGSEAEAGTNERAPKKRSAKPKAARGKAARAARGKRTAGRKKPGPAGRRKAEKGEEGSGR